jgi:DNA-binding NtrC family response regulator
MGHEPVSHQVTQTTKPDSKRLLLAEDDEALRTLLADTLRRDGYDVIEARHGIHLLEVLEPVIFEGDVDERPDLIISDYHMPGCTGMSILAGLHSSGLDIPFIVITAFGDAETHIKARHLGAVAVFDKPFDLDDLRTAVLNYMRPH